MRAGLFDDVELVGAKLRHSGRWHLDYDVDPAKQHFCDARIGIRDRAEDDGLRPSSLRAIC